MNRPVDDGDYDIEYLRSSSGSSPLRNQMQQFIKANGGEIDLKAERKIGTDDDMLSSVVIDNRDEHR